MQNEPRPVIPPTGENLLVAKDAHIASLQGELREKRNMLQNRSKVKAGFIKKPGEGWVRWLNRKF